MVFKIEITDEHTKMFGKKNDLLIGLSLYIIALRKSGISTVEILGSIVTGLEKDINQEDNSEAKTFEFKKTNKRKMDKFIKDNLKDLFDWQAGLRHKF